MTDTTARAQAAHRARWGIALLTLLFASYFFGGAASNQNARLDAIYAFVEPGTPDTGSFRIDRFMASPKRSINTLDLAAYDGHFYANKAPGSIWLGILAYTPLVALESWFGGSYDAPFFVIANAYVINLCVSVLPVVGAALAMFELVSGLGLTVAQASLVSLSSVLGTVWFPYATQLWGHTTAAALIALAVREIQRNSARAAAFAGVLLSMAVCVDYLAILSAVTLGALVLWTRHRHVPAFALGALPFTLLLMAYHTLCFGGPFVTAAQMSNVVFLDEERTLGMFGSLSVHALWELTFGLRRGLFVQCPVLILSLFGFYRWLREKPLAPLAVISLLNVLGYLVANASFNGWHGGATVGARYLICALPFLALGMHSFPWSSRWMMRLFIATTLFSILNMSVIAAINPLAPDDLNNPLYGYSYRMFWEGKVSPYPFAFKLLILHPDWKRLSTFAMWNLGELAGLKGLWSLLPLLFTAGAVTVRAWFVPLPSDVARKKAAAA